MDHQPEKRNRRSQRSPARKRPVARRNSRRGSRLAPLLAVLGGGLAIIALVMLINYQRQANDLRREQESLRQAYLSGLKQEQQGLGQQAAPFGQPQALASQPPGSLKAREQALETPLLMQAEHEIGYDELPRTMLTTTMPACPG